MTTQQAPRFDAREIAAEATRNGKDPVGAVIGQLAGFAGGCWSNLPAAGDFLEEPAAYAVDSATSWMIGQLEAATAGQRIGRVEEGDRLLLLTGHTDLTLEEVTRIRDQLGAAMRGAGSPVTVLSSVGAAIIVAADARPGVTLDVDEEVRDA